jgi:hypothetical protein
VDVAQVAAWDEHTTLRLDPASAVNSGSNRVAEGSDGEIDAAPLDDILLPPPAAGIDLIKLDVEGADLHALRGMAGVLRECRPVLVVEDHSMYDYYSHDELINCLAGLGYGSERIKVDLAGDRIGLYVIARPLRDA